MIKPFFFGMATMSGILVGLAIAFPIEAEPVQSVMAGPPSCVTAATDAPPIELILASLPAQMKPYIMDEPPMMTLPRPRPERDAIGKLIGGL